MALYKFVFFCYNKALKLIVLFLKDKKLFKKLSILFSLLCVFILAGCATPPPETFSISGRVMYSDTPVSNCLVTSNTSGEVTTKEDGAFAFSGLLSATELTFSAEGYVFSKPKEVIYGQTSDLIILAEKTYTLTGRVVSNGIPVSGARVEVAGLTPCSLTTNSNGEFSAIVAGRVDITVTKTGLTFAAGKFATIDNPNIIFSGTTDVEAKVVGVDGATVLLGQVPMTFENGTYSAKNIALGSVLTPELEGYHFEPASYTIKYENEIVTFTAQKIYEVQGTTLCGQTAVAGVDVYLNGQFYTTTSVEGKYTISGIWGQNSISLNHAVYKFNSSMVTDTITLTHEGTFALTGRVVYLDENLENVRVTLNGGAPTPTNAEGKFSLPSVKFGDILTFEREGYLIASRQITSASSMVVTAQKYFNAKITVREDDAPLSIATALVNGESEPLTASKNGLFEFTNLLEGFSLTITAPNYTTEIVTISRDNNEIQVNLDRYYTAKLNVRSGDIKLSNAVVTANGQPVTLSGIGRAELENCLGQLNVVVSCEGYTGTTVIASKNNTSLDINLSYEVTGYVRSGEVNIDALVKATSILLPSQTPFVETTNTESGEFAFTLYGENTISVEVDGFVVTPTADSNTLIRSEGVVNFTATYSISGTLESENLSVEGATVHLLSGESDDYRQITVGADGKYNFDTLAGTYILWTENDMGIQLRPGEHLITRGGVYDFSANGYAVVGTVFCGTEPLANVTFTAGDYTAVSDRLGNFRFDLVTGNPTISAKKTGYVFLETYTLAPEDEGTVYTFTATYSISGIITCGGQPLGGVVVTLDNEGATMTTDQDGKYAFSGLTGSHTVNFVKADYEIAPVSVTGYASKNVTATRTIRGVVMVGESPVEGVKISNGITFVTTDEKGNFTLTGLECGDVLTATKLGFTFTTSNATISLTSGAVDFNGSYSISGVVKSAGKVVSNVTVSFNGQNTTTDASGNFTLSNLTSFGNLILEKAGYEFAPVPVNGPRIGTGSNTLMDLEISASFAVSGVVTMGGVGVEGVIISSNGQNTTTDSFGNYTLSGLSSSGWVEVSKAGYEFSGNRYYSGAIADLNLEATYFVDFTVNGYGATLGDIVIDTNADLTKIENTYRIQGLTGPHAFSVNALNFNSKEFSLTKPIEKFEVVLDYNITLKLLDGDNKDIATHLDGVTLTYTDKSGEGYTTKEHGLNFTNGEAKLLNIIGNGSWTISKSGYKFTPNTDTYSIGKSTNISFQKVYSISGRVTSGSFAVGGMLMSINNETATTDSNGNYTISNIVGKGSLTGTLKAPNCDSITVKKDNLDSTQTVNFDIESLDNGAKKYAYWLFQKGYQNLRDSAGGYMIKTKALIDPDTSLAGDQHAESIKLRDKNGVYVFQSKNNGDPVKIMGIEPRVDLVGYYDPRNGNTNDMYYNFYQGDKVTYDSNAGTVNTSDSAVSTMLSSGMTAIKMTGSDNAYFNTFGSLPTGFYPYSITNINNITSASYSKSGSEIRLKLTFNHADSNIFTNYYVQMLKFSGQKPEEFKKLIFEYVMDLNGNFKSNHITEQYLIDQLGGITINANHDETFYYYTNANTSPLQISKAKDIKTISNDTWNFLKAQNNPSNPLYVG